MSLDRSLKTSASLARHRNVLSRAERVAKLTERGRFDVSTGSPLHLPKVGNPQGPPSPRPAKKRKPQPRVAERRSSPRRSGIRQGRGPGQGQRPAAAKPAAKAAAKK